MLKKIFMMVFVMAVSVCAYSGSAQAATYTQSVSGKISVLGCQPIIGQATSTMVSVTVRDSNIPASAKITKVVFKSGGVADVSGQPIISAQAILIDPTGRQNVKPWGSGNATTFNSYELAGGTAISPLGKWTLGYIGNCSLGSGIKSHTKLSLEFTYTL